ncbi:hypothetical protein QCN29_09675 [Streptomyces sp. HNM0663]|uniref:Uncharacterized protein n=1 Tax=Streptomyces chengmaiensis TaxID=3040919 RepID=A0ABT6HK05_9ACTN|nr:hypothetical protein [Streptomyces chengmaiensis]MDH2389055.1 hypothetical protein [Streptomyces chengmaiensis]
MSTAPAPGPRAAERLRQKSSPDPASTPKLIFDDPLDQQSADDTDRGWGERAPGSGDSAADLARFLDEKPPHHL